MQWNTALLDKYVAPGISAFVNAEAPDLRAEFPQAPFWLRNHFLNNVLRGSLPEKPRKVVLAFLRRTHAAFNAYHDAREVMARYLEGNQPDNPSIQGYYDAVGHWETFAIQYGMALDLFRWLNNGTGAFVKNDGTAESRLYTLANQIKHVASCVESGQTGANENVPLWLTNQGLQSFRHSVSFGEAAEMLRDLARLADQLQDPQGSVEGRRTSEPGP